MATPVDSTMMSRLEGKRSFGKLLKTIKINRKMKVFLNKPIFQTYTNCKINKETKHIILYQSKVKFALYSLKVNHSIRVSKYENNAHR